MSTGFRSAAARIATAVDRHLYNSEIEIGRTADIVSTLRPIETADPVQFEAGKNIIVRGIHRSPHESVSGVEGYQPTVTTPALVPSELTEMHQVVRRGARLGVRLLDDAPDIARIAYEVRRWEPDGRYRALYYLHFLGLVRRDVAVLGFGVPFGMPFAPSQRSAVAAVGFGAPFGTAFASAVQTLDDAGVLIDIDAEVS